MGAINGAGLEQCKELIERDGRIEKIQVNRDEKKEKGEREKGRDKLICKVEVIIFRFRLRNSI